jgi:hypothetical protein
MNSLRLIFLSILVCLSLEVKTQEKSISQIENIQSVEDRPLNNISLNLLGDASIISINYEKQYLVGKSYVLSTKFGLGYNQEFCISFGNGSCSPVEDYLTIPHHFTANIGKRRSFFEFGLGGTILSGETSEPYILYGIIGYRFLPFHSNKFNFRIYLQPPIPIKELEKPVDNDFPHPDIRYFPVGVSAGISF